MGDGRIQVREAVAEDAPRLTDIARAAKAHWGYPAEWLEVWKDQLCFSPAYLEANLVLVAVDGGGAAMGVAALELDLGQGELGHLWVDPPCMGLGVGRALMEETARRASDLDLHSLRIEADPHAVGFYEHFGARVVGDVAAPVVGNDRRLPVLEWRVTP